MEFGRVTQEELNKTDEILAGQRYGRTVFFMHMHDETTSPELTVYLVDKINDAMHLTHTKPVFVSQQNTLF